MNNRIRELRKKVLNKSQKEFAERLGLSENFIWQIEKGEREPSDRTITAICREFNVNKDWLLTGKGEMRTALDRDKAVSDFLADVMRSESEDFRRRMVAVLSKLDVSEWELLEKMALKLAEETKKEGQA